MSHRMLGIIIAGGLFCARVAGAAETLELEVRETAGIERFHYPLTAEVNLPAAASAATALRLREGNRTVAAQFTPMDESSAGTSQRWAIDFGLDLQPNQTKSLALEYGAGVSAESLPKRGLKVERSAGKIRVRHPSLEFLMTENLGGLFEAIEVSGDAWLAGKSAGLVIASRTGQRVPLVFSADGAARVTKSGPLAAAIEQTGAVTVDGEKIHSLVELDFPLGKSWVRVDWVLDDPRDLVQNIAAELRLRLQADGKPPVLADVGAAGWTYAALRPDESLVFQASPTAGESRPHWKVERVHGAKASLYAAPPGSGRSPPPEGWAHLMDAKRATAIAVDAFAAETSDTIALGADGGVRLGREFPAGRTMPVKRLVFWLHVVSSPPQWGAATSPQSMLAPPDVRVVAPEGKKESSR